MFRAGVLAGLMLASVLMGAGAAEAQSLTRQEQDEMAKGLLSRTEHYCLAASDPEQTLARARADGFVSPPGSLAAMAQRGAADGRVLWKIADAELWVLMVGAIQRPEG